MTTVRFALLALASPMALAVACAPAHAQDQIAPPNDPADANGSEIVVTAQLIEQTPLEVPFALTAYSGDFMQELGITEFDRLSQFVPGFEVQNQSPNNPGFVIRGITSDSGSAFNEPRVSVFQDGVSISKSRGSYVELFDIERVEVARGPQSTLYGRGALIGAVNIVQAKADPYSGYGYLYGDFGNFGRARGDMTVNMPLGGDLGIRVAARVRERDGYVENLLGGEDYNGIKSQAVRGSLRWSPDRFTFDLIGNYEHDSASGTSFKSIYYNPTDPVTGTVLGDMGRNSGAALAAADGFPDGGLGLDRQVWGVTGIGNYEFNDNLSLNVIGSFRRFDNLEVFDPDGISLPLLTASEDSHGDQTMATMRLTYAVPDVVTAFVGATFYRETGDTRVDSQFDERVTLARLTNTLNGGGAIPGRAATDPAPYALFNNTAFTAQLLQGVAGAYGVALPFATAQAIASNLQSDYLETSTNRSETTSWDLFGDVTFHLSEQFEVGAGIRYSHDAKTTGFSSQVLNGRSVLGGFIAAMSLDPATQSAILSALTVPGAAYIPMSAGYPIPYFGLGVQPTGNNTGANVEQDMDDGGFTWRVTARYEVNPDVSVYGNYARGRRPQVLGVSGPSTPGGLPQFEVLPAETVDSFELGVKTLLDGRRLSLDGSVFYYNYNNFQTTEQIGTLFVTVNAGKAESYGFEGQMRWSPTEWATVFGTYAYNHSRFSTGARDGNRFRLSPDHSASFGVRFEAPVGTAGSVDFTPSVTWQSRVFFDDDNDLPSLQAGNLIPDLIQDEYQNSYALVDARLGFTTADRRWRIEAFVTNLFEQNYIKDAGNTGDSLGLPTFIAGEPRMYGLSLSLTVGER